MEKKLTVDELYSAFSALHDSSQPQITPEIIFNNVYSQFSCFDTINQQNFLTFLSEDYELFSTLPTIFEKIMEIGNKLLTSDNLANQTTALATLTKLWLKTPLDQSKEEKLHEFINYLFTKSNDMNEVPHLRNICSQCIYEISSMKGPDFIKIPAEKLLESANNNHAPTSYSELAYLLGCDNEELKKFLDKRFWSMSPIESTVFAPEFLPKYPLIPNDPLLLRNVISKEGIPHDSALSLIYNPFSSFGVAQTICGFTDTFEFDSSALFSPLDKDEEIAMKSKLLPPKIASIDGNPVISSFVDQKSDSAVVAAAFSLASRFSSSEIFQFYKKYYEKTPDFDEHWSKLYDSLDKQTKETIKCFLIRFSSRKSAQKALIQSENGNIPISVIEKCDEEMSKLLLNVMDKLSPEKAAERLFDFYNQWKNGKIIPPPEGPFSVAKVIHPVIANN